MMVLRTALLGLAIACGVPYQASATVTITAGDHVLDPDTPLQIVQVLISSDVPQGIRDASLCLYISPITGPVMTSVDMTSPGTVFGDAPGGFGPQNDFEPFPTRDQFSQITTFCCDTSPPEGGVLANVEIDTTSISTGEFPFRLLYDPFNLPASTTSSPPQATVLVDGTLIVVDRLVLTDTTNIALAARQIEAGGNTTDNPDVTAGAGGALIPYTETGSFTCCGPTFLGDNLDDGDVGTGIASDGTYAIPDSGTLVLDFGSDETLTSIAIYTGYANRDDGTYTLRDDTSAVLGAWTITTPLGSANAGTVSYWLTFDTPVETSSLTLEMASTDVVDTSSFREIQVFARPRIIDDTNITLAATQIESGDDMSENPDVTGGTGGTLVPYTASGSFTCCGGVPYLADNLGDGDVGAGVMSDGTYAIPDSGALLLDLGAPHRLTSIAIYNGYTNRDDGTYTLRDDASNVLGIWTISTPEAADSNDGVDSFWLTFDEPVTTSSLTLEIASTDEDSTASFREIQVFGGPASVPAMDARAHALTVGILLLVAVSMLRRQRTEEA